MMMEDIYFSHILAFSELQCSARQTVLFAVTTVDNLKSNKILLAKNIFSSPLYTMNIVLAILIYEHNPIFIAFISILSRQDFVLQLGTET
jgi:hypothetical protein